MNILDQIIADKKIELLERKAALPVDRLRTAAEEAPGRPDFVRSLLAAPMGLIAEVKRRSPSAGSIREPFDPAAIGRAYEQSGASAVSVLMDHKYFGGGEADFKLVRGGTRLPLLYKEFVVDEWQLWHALALGASAILFIVAALDRATLRNLCNGAMALGLEPLVEVHDEEETRIAVDLGVRCIGVNNRNLKTFEVSLETTHRLGRLVPSSTLLVGESGIKTADDILQLQQSGARAVLVGETLLRQPDLGEAVRNLMGKAWASS